jgi:dephospho-CoA kinase
MFILGLTGQTGAGKSIAAARLKKNGFAVIDADREAKRAQSPGSPCVKELARYFGGGILLPDGGLDRKKLASIAFSDKEKLAMLNRITHPHIMAQIINKIFELKNDGVDFLVLDAPALFEAGAEKLCQKTIAVVAPEELRVSRIMLRDGLTELDALERIKAQPDESFYTGRADYVLRNDGNVAALEEKVDEIAGSIKGLAQGKQ